MFQQTLVTVSNADQPSDTIRWGETVNPEEIEDQATNRDQESNKKAETEREHENTKKYAEIVRTINTLPDNHYAWGYMDPTKAYYANEDSAGQGGTMNREREDFITWYDMQIYNMAEIKATQFLMDYYNGPTMDTDDSLAASPEDEASSKIEQVPGKQEDNGKPGNEEREPSIKTATLTQLTHMEGEANLSMRLPALKRKQREAHPPNLDGGESSPEKKEKEWKT
jgi:hypothetical protein